MVINAISWLWIIISTFFAGMMVYRLAGKLHIHIEWSLDQTLVFGMCFYTIYAETMSIFMPVNRLAMAGVVCITVVSAFFVRKDLLSSIKSLIEKRKQLERWKWLPAVAIFVCFLMLSAALPFADDDYGYHIQAIKWIHLFGVTKGQAVLHARFGFNSAFLSLQALHSFPEITGYGLHQVNGLYGMLLALYALLSFHSRNMKTADVLKVIVLALVIKRYEWAVGVETDPLAIYMTYYVFIKWAEYSDRQAGTDAFAILATIGTFAVTLKLSAAPLMLLILFPLCIFIKQKRWRRICGYALLNVIVVLPYMIRSVLITGYILFPSTILDVLQVPWKLPAEITKSMSDLPIVWARGTQHFQTASWSENARLSFRAWFPHWFINLTVFYKVALLVFFLSLVALLLWSCIRIRNKAFAISADLYLTIVGGAAVLFWLLSAPAMRFGEGWLLLFAGAFYSMLGEDARRGTAILFTIVLIFHTQEMLKDSHSHFRSIGIILPTGYWDEENIAFETGITYRNGEPLLLYSSVPGADRGWCNEALFPVTNDAGNIEHVGFLGSSFEDGFYYK